MAPDAVITPWEVRGAIDYDKLIKQFGTHPLGLELRMRITRAAGESNMLLDREVYFSHRDLDLVLQDHEAGKEFFRKRPVKQDARRSSAPIHAHQMAAREIQCECVSRNN